VTPPGSSAVRVNAVTVTHLTAVSAALAWMVAEWRHRGKPTVLGIASGAVAGLATSTAGARLLRHVGGGLCASARLACLATSTDGAGLISPLAGVVMGIAAGICSYMAIVWKGKIGYDDT